MKFTFDKDAMIKEISVAQEIITNKSPVSILSNILIIAENNMLTIKATDTTVKFISTIPVDIQEEGRTTIFCDKLMSILSLLPAGEVEFIQNGNEVTIKPIAKRFTAKLKSQASDKFPEIGSSENIPFFEVPLKDFKEMIRHTIFAVSSDKIRFYMEGDYLVKEGDVLTMVATDGKRLSCVNKSGVNIPDFQPAIIPTKILSLILKHAPDEGNIQLSVVEKSLFVKFSNYEFSTVLLDGLFPNYKKVIPTDLKSSFQVNKNDLDAALRRTAIMVDKKVSKIIFNISAGELKLISPENDNGCADEIIPCRYDGPTITVGFNIEYLLDPLKVIDSENVVFNFSLNEESLEELPNIKKAVIIKSDNDGDYFHVIMPMMY